MMAKSFSKRTILARSIATLFVGGSCILATPAVQATDYTWDAGGGTTRNWQTVTNWVGDALPTFDDNANIIFYTGINGVGSSLGSDNRTIGALTFNSSATTSFTLFLSNNANDSGLARVLTLGSVSVAPTITLDAASANQTIGSAQGSITLANNLTTTISGTKTLTINRPIDGVGFGNTKDGTGTLTLSGANTYSGTTTVSGGLLTLNNALALQNSTLDTLNSIASISATTGLRTTVTTLTLGGLSGNKNLASLFDAANGYSGVTALTLNPGTGATPSYSGVIADGTAGMTLTQTGVGTQTLTGTNTYTGPTTISAGRLVINGDQSAATGVVTVASAGTLAGNGIIGGAVVVNGRLAPGNSPDEQTYNDGVTFNPGSTFEVELLGATVGNGVTGYDSALITSGNVLIDTTGAGVTLDLLTPGGSGYTLGSNLWIINNTGAGTLSGTFAGLANGSQVTALDGLGGYNWQIIYGADQGTNSIFNLGNDVALNAFQAIPEPSTLVLGGLALLGLAGAGLRRRRMAKQ